MAFSGVNKKPMKRTIHKEITIETHRVTVIRSGGGNRGVTCPHCGSESLPLTLTQVAEALGLNDVEVRALLGDGGLHEIDKSAGEQVICGLSISDKLRK